MNKEITIFVTLIVYTLKLCFLFGNSDGHLYCCNLPRIHFTKIIATNSCRYHTNIISGFVHGFPVARMDTEFPWNFVYPDIHVHIYRTFIGFHTQSTSFASGELSNIASVQMLQLLKLLESRVKICEITGYPCIRENYCQNR